MAMPRRYSNRPLIASTDPFNVPVPKYARIAARLHRNVAPAL
jgi:hypothetical protein